MLRVTSLVVSMLTSMILADSSNVFKPGDVVDTGVGAFVKA